MSNKEKFEDNGKWWNGFANNMKDFELKTGDDITTTPPADDKEYRAVVNGVTDMLQGWIDDNRIEDYYKPHYTRLIADIKKGVGI